MSTYKSPGVYVEEISVFPPSVAPVSTAVPAFLGYTEKAVDASGKSIGWAATPPATSPVPIRISTFLDYQNLFGGPPATGYTVEVKANMSADGKTPDGTYTITDLAPTPAGSPSFILYYAIQLYFQNGGGPCYIVSVGSYQTTSPSDTDFTAGLTALDAEDEPTILLAPDAVNLSNNDYLTMCQALLADAGKLKDRFAILDVPKANPTAADITNFRTAVGTDNLDYGAAYTPYLQTTIAEVDATTLVKSNVQVNGPKMVAAAGWSLSQENCIQVAYLGQVGATLTISAGTADGDITFSSTPATLGSPAVSADPSTDTAAQEAVPAAAATLTITNVASRAKGKTGATVTGLQIVEAWSSSQAAQTAGFTITSLGSGTKPVTLVPASPLQPNQAPSSSTTLDKISPTGPYGALYNQILAALYARTVTLPPSAAIAGVYCATDASRGVWKAPANVGLLGVTGPTVKITNDQQDALNVDTSGKSINAIRAFTGQGTLVWGARTLLGNDNNWRYISVRRLFIFMEESIQQSTSWAVFEPNVTTTWLKVKASIESFLYGLWQQGALAGSTPQEAYFVNIGLGKTMTQADILAGNLIVEVGAAPSRPAEFVVLRIMQKLQGA